LKLIESEENKQIRMHEYL